MRMFPLVPLISLACHRDPPLEVPVAEVCAAPTARGKVSWADANRDGALDVSDHVYTERWLMNGGPQPACDAAQDLMDLGDGLIDLSDGTGILYNLFVGNFDLPAGSPACDDPRTPAEVPCGQVGLVIDAPAKADAPFEASVWLAAPDLDVQAWSYGLRAEGCTVTAATEAGTAIADARLDPEGRRDKGFSRLDVVGEGATQAAVLSWERDVTLPKRAEAWKLAAFTVTPDDPADKCGTCTLTLASDLKGGAKKVAAVLTASGRSYPLPVATTTVEVCR